MNQNNFGGYLANNFNLIGGIVSFIVLISTYIKTHKIWPSICLLLAVLVVFLIISLYKMFKDLKTTKEQFSTETQERIDLEQRYDNLLSRFDIQAEKYQENIQELNNYKHVAHVVDVIVNSSTARTKDAQDIITSLRFSIEKKLKDSE